LDEFFPTRIKHPDKICRARYSFLSRQSRRNGPESSEVQHSKRELVALLDDMWYLKKRAYKPTGVALGCPLPNASASRLLWRASKLVSDYLDELCSVPRPTFGFVRPEFYHVTLLNRTHFEFPEAAPLHSESEIFTNEQKVLAQKVISEVIGNDAIGLHINGLILTAQGRLIARGFPCDDRIYKVKSALLKEMPELVVNVPTTTHIKLGHILTTLDIDAWRKILDWLTQIGDRINTRLTFYDVYTPVGRIDLRG